MMLYGEKKYGYDKYGSRKKIPVGEYLNAADLTKISESILRVAKIVECCGYINVNVDTIKEEWKRKDFLTLKNIF